MTEVASGWQPDPSSRFDHRWWSGEAWTEHVSGGGEQTTDAVDQGWAAPTAGSVEADATGSGTAEIPVHPPPAPGEAAPPPASADGGDGGPNWKLIAGVGGAAAVVIVLVLVFLVGGDDGPSGDGAVGSAAEAIADLDAAGIDGCNLEADAPPDGIDPGDAQVFIEGALGVAQNAEAAGDEQRPDPVDAGSCSGPPAGVALAVFADEDATREYDGWFATHVEDCVPRVVGANWMAVTLSTESDSTQLELAEQVADTLGGEVIERCAGADDGPAETPDGALEEYPPEFEDNFLSSCVAAGGTDDSCQCALDRIQATFTVEEFIELDQQSAGGEIPPVLAETIADCL